MRRTIRLSDSSTTTIKFLAFTCVLILAFTFICTYSFTPARIFGQNIDIPNTAKSTITGNQMAITETDKKTTITIGGGVSTSAVRHEGKVAGLSFFQGGADQRGILGFRGTVAIINTANNIYVAAIVSDPNALSLLETALTSGKNVSFSGNQQVKSSLITVNGKVVPLYTMQRLDILG